MFIFEYFEACFNATFPVYSDVNNLPSVNGKKLSVFVCWT